MDRARTIGVLTGGLAVLGLALVSGAGRAQTPSKPSGPRFDTEVLPILKASCLSCHAGKEASGKLDLTRRVGLVKGGVSGSALNAKQPDRSLFVRAIRHDGRQMPPQGKLPQTQIDTLTAWIKAGAPWGTAVAAPAHQGPPKVDAKARRFWSFQPVRRPAVPAVKNAAWVKSPIDAFVLAKLEARKMSPAPPVGKAALLRRVTYDLIGLPPTPQEIQAFVADPDPGAYEKAVDRLLESPQYGEKWARHWLDLVRYAETNSFERDGDKPNVWRYRDWVIRSLNADKPYDRFLTEQLAGDELAETTPDTLIATGYYRLGQWDDEPVDARQARYDELDDIVTTTGQTMLGLTVNCARCHDHKIDPVPQKDYYRLVAFFDNINRYGNRSHESVEANSLRTISTASEQERYASETRAWRQALADVQRPLTELENRVKPTFIPVEHEEFRDEFKRAGLLQKRVPATISQDEYDGYVKGMAERERLRRNPPRGLEMALCVTEPGAKMPATTVMLRGNANAPGDPVTPGVLSVLAPLDVPVDDPEAGSKSAGLRRQFADWVANPANPLTSRVMANRLWQWHFGRGIVRTTSNFGYMGTPPTHPELLDWLASEFVRQGWSLKKMHRLMVTSNTYRMSSKPNPTFLARDPENDLYWRFDMRRLEAEEIRDSILAVTGALNLKMYGPSIFAPIPEEVLAGQSVPGAGWGKSSPEDESRRSVYVKIKRSLVVPIFASFDGADTDLTCPVRNATVVPTQALSLINSVFIQQQASRFADRVKADAGADLQAQVRTALWRVLQRAPTAKEIRRGVDLMDRLQTREKLSGDAALQSFCLVALNLNEFLYLD